jgi:plasmid stabilization system protein ParE
VKVVLTRNAEQDLEDIGDWIARDNPARAATFVVELRRASLAIGKAPRSYPLVDKNRDPKLRRRIYGNYLIFYDIGSSAVEILHVLRGARDYAAIVFADEAP